MLAVPAPEPAPRQAALTDQSLGDCAVVLWCGVVGTRLRACVCEAQGGVPLVILCVFVLSWCAPFSFCSPPKGAPVGVVFGTAHHPHPSLLCGEGPATI